MGVKCLSLRLWEINSNHRIKVQGLSPSGTKVQRASILSTKTMMFLMLNIFFPFEKINRSFS